MKRLKKLLPALIAIMMAFALAFAVACSGSCKSCGGGEDPVDPDPQDEVTEKLDSITVNTDNAKVLYYLNEDFSKDGVVVTALFKKSDGTERTADVSSQAFIDSKNFNSAVEGTYQIDITYIVDADEAHASYNVKVQRELFGANVILTDAIVEGVKLSETASENIEGVYELSEEHKTITIDPSKIEVRKPDNTGNVDYSAAALAADKYDVAVYHYVSADKEHKLLEDYTNLGAGIYQIWVTLKEDNDGYKAEAFALLYVIDNPVELTFNQSGAKLSQIAIEDEITPTWNFTVKYATGKTAVVNFSDEGIKADPAVDTTVVGTHSTTVSYTAKNEKGDEITVRASSIEYTINARPTPTGQITYTLTFAIGSDNEWGVSWSSNAQEGANHDILQRDYDDNVKIVSGGKDGLDVNSDKSVTIDEKSFTKYSQIKNTRAAKVTVGTKATDVTITAYVDTGTANRTVYIATELGSDKNLPANAKITAQQTLASKNTGAKVTASSVAAADYYVASNDTCRLWQVVVTYTVDYDTAPTYQNVSFDTSTVYTSQGYNTETNVGAFFKLYDEHDVKITTGTDKKSKTDGFNTSDYKCGKSEQYLMQDDGTVSSTVKYTHRLKLKGAIAVGQKSESDATKAVYNAISIEVPAACTMDFYMRTGTAGTARKAWLYTLDGSSLTPVGTLPSTNNVEHLCVSGNNDTQDRIYKITITVSAAGTYYLGSPDGGVGLYHVDIKY